MNLLQIAHEFCKDNMAAVVVIGLSLIEITPIKINPVSSFLKWIGNRMNGAIMEKVVTIEDDVKKMKADRELDKVLGARTRILRFADECFCGVLHSQEHYNQILDDLKFYESYCEKNPNFLNDKTQIASNIIKEKYKDHIENHDFLDQVHYREKEKEI